MRLREISYVQNVIGLVIQVEAILAFSETFDQHLNNRGALFENYTDTTLSGSPPSASFFPSEVAYLGHVVTEDGIKTNPEKLMVLTLNAPSATIDACLSCLLKCLKSLYSKQCGPRSDCRSSLFWILAVYFYT